MKTAIRLLGSALTLFGMVVVSPAAVLLNDNFDGYANQATFEGAWTPTGSVAPTSATLATDQAASETQSVRIDGTATSFQQGNQRSFDESGTVMTSTITIFSFDFYDSNAAAAPFRQHSFLLDGGGISTGQSIGMGLNNNQLFSDSGGNFYMARIGGYIPTEVDPDGGPNERAGLTAGNFFKLNDSVNSPLRSTGWHNLMVEISTDDGLSADFAFYVDGILAEQVSNVGTEAQLRSYDSVRLGSGYSNADNAAWYDNFNVSVVPEPSVAGLWLAAAIALACRRRRVAVD